MIPQHFMIITNKIEEEWLKLSAGTLTALLKVHAFANGYLLS